MLTIKKLFGVHVTEALPTLPIDEGEAKIARIPGWRSFITPHKNFLDPVTKAITERVNGVSCAPHHSLSECDPFTLGTLADGNPAFVMGLDEGSVPTWYPLPIPDSTEMTEFMVFAAGPTVSTASMQLFSRRTVDDIDVGKLFFNLHMGPAATQVRKAVHGTTSFTTVINDTAHSSTYTAQKTVYAMATYSPENGFHLYVDGALAGSATSNGEDLDPDTVPIIGFADELRGKVGAAGVLSIDLSKKVNAGYRAALDAWVLGKFTMGN